MSTSILSLAPFIPSDQVLEKSSLPDKAMELNKQSAQLMGHISELTFATLSQYMSVLNSYYSNLIEGNATHPHDIREAQRNVYSDMCLSPLTGSPPIPTQEDPSKRDLQLESLAHISVQ